jgi:hypothetical protein
LGAPISGSFPPADLSAADLGGAQGREIGVVVQPVEQVAEGGDSAEQEQERSHAFDERQERVGRRGDQRAGDQQRLDAPALGQGQHGGTQQQPSADQRGLEQQRHRNRDAGLEQEGENEDAAGALGQGLETIVGMHATDRVCGLEGHGDLEEFV